MLRMSLAPAIREYAVHLTSTQFLSFAHSLPPLRIIESFLVAVACNLPPLKIVNSFVGGRFSMLRMGLSPCAPFNVTQDLMKAAAKLARQHQGVRLHTHLAENEEDIEYARKTFNCRPGEYIK